MVRKILEESQVLGLLLTKGVTRMKEIPAAADGGTGVEIEISSDEDIEMDVEEPEGVPRRLRRGDHVKVNLLETLRQMEMRLRSMMKEQRTWGVNRQMPRNDEQMSDTFEFSSRR